MWSESSPCYSCVSPGIGPVYYTLLCLSHSFGALVMVVKLNGKKRKIFKKFARDV